MRTYLITGVAGFIGSRFVDYMVRKYPDDTFVGVDNLTYAGNVENLKTVAREKNFRFHRVDICDEQSIREIFSNNVIDYVVNFAAESHVDRSIENPHIFLLTNVLGTQVLLQLSREFRISKFVQISTDEVYGSLGGNGYFTEDTPLQPNSPYSASKASADMIVRSYGETYGLNISITRCSNNYGPFQFPEKLIPLSIVSLLEGKTVKIYGDGSNVRDWLHVSDHCSGIERVLMDGRPGEVYNIGGFNERTNLDIARLLVNYFGKSESWIEFVPDRLGHDRRYAIDSTKITDQLGWRPAYTFHVGLVETVEWYVNNQRWWKDILSGDYKANETTWLEWMK